ncbi:MULTISPECIES: DUF4192 family protein [unclassified Rathayibacter]|uniref:DUF4192 family protein n=1 Tax=unclassified Rathayibacter TaxID=2609250 RepID=UPI0006F6D949|nr:MULTISPECIES: DUF4192 family protein [unclassified Rathayibacter]KQQ00895.1 hypothetical protein ASF42_16445 [Rathayibacter sp. Leaf294]KQS10298.1 hypothetical protein ASG06_16445 [Rathayibacter sp. Leaf185]
MTLTALEPHRTSHRIVASIPDLVGFSPRESVVLVPLRQGRATGALRFDLPAEDAPPCARAFIGALGCFGRAEAVVAVVYTERPDEPQNRVLTDALIAAARRVGIHDLDVVVDPGSPSGARGERGGSPGVPAERRLLPDVDRSEARAVGAQVDLLLDRHPRAELSESVRSSVDALLRRAAAGWCCERRSQAVAALIVCAQRQGWREHALRIAAASNRPPSSQLLELLGAAAASAPATERAPVLVVLASVTWAAGRREDAVRLASWAVRSDPHDPEARRLVCALEQASRAPGRIDTDLAA